MKELPGKVTPWRVSFKTGLQSTYTNGKLESSSRSDNCLHGKERASCCSCCYCSSLEIPQSPINAMEFLSRSWSPSSFNFQQIFTSRNKVLTHNKSNSDVENEGDADNKSSSQVREEKLEIEELNEFSAQRSSSISRVDDILWMNSKPKRGWLRGNSLASLLRHHRVKKKEEIRLHTANVHAAISVTQLAAAIAGYAAKGCIGRAKDDNPTINEGTVVEVKNMDNIIASAAALLATVCAETAESVGAHTNHVASAINSGLANQTTTADMITLIATTATCLRGASTLKLRAMANTKFPKKQKLIEVKAQLSVITPSGHRSHSCVSIYSKHDQLMLSLQIKYFGVIPKTKEYKILHVMEKKMESQGHSITLKSNEGNIKLVFKDENQSLLWISNISNILKMQS